MVNKPKFSWISQTSLHGQTGVLAVAAAILVNLSSVLPLFLTGAMAVQIARTVQVAPTTIGASTAVFAAATLLGSAPLGAMVGRWGTQRSLRITATFSIVAAGIAAASQSLPPLIGALLLAGVGNALGQPAGNSLVAAHVSSRRYGIGFAIKQSAIPLATLLGGLAVPAIALNVGWQWAYVAVMIVAGCAMVIIPPDVAREQRREDAVPKNRRVPLWVLAMGVSFAVAAATSIGALGSSGAVAAGVGEAQAGYIIAAGGFAGLTIRLVAGWWADRWDVDALYGVAVLCVLGAVGWSLMAINVPLAFGIGLVVANAFGWGWPGLQHLAIARRFPTSTAAASGVSQTGVAFGLLAGPVSLGAVAAVAGWSWMWIITAASALIGAVAIAWSSRLLPRTKTFPLS